MKWEGSWERYPGHHIPTPLLGDNGVPDGVEGGEPGAGAGRKQGHLRGLNPDPAVLGVPPPVPFAFSCSSSHRFKGEKQNLSAAMSRVQ